MGQRDKTDFRPGQARDKAGTASIKALAARVLDRDKARDNSGTTAPKSCPKPSVPVGQDQGLTGEVVPAVPLVPGVPKEWEAGHAAMHAMPPPTGFSAERWQRISSTRPAKFLARWAADAAIRSAGATLDVFGCHSTRPIAGSIAWGWCCCWTAARSSASIGRCRPDDRNRRAPAVPSPAAAARHRLAVAAPAMTGCGGSF